MALLMKIRLKNFCNYQDYTFNFCDKKNKPYKYICFFGPNGIGKSSLLEAISLLSMNHSGRQDDYIKNSLQKYVRNSDYQPGYLIDQSKTQDSMLIEGTYVLNNKQYVISLTENGFIRNDFLDDTELWPENKLRHLNRLVHIVKADSDISMNNFQLYIECASEFEEIISEITRYKAKCIQPNDSNDFRASRINYCTDFVLIKNEMNIHFKRMSAGERKIVKAFSDLLNSIHTLKKDNMSGWPRIILLDNVEMHVYYDRHVSFINKLKTVFNEQQIFTTTHSGTLIENYLNNKNDKNELWFDIEKINS